MAASSKRPHAVPKESFGPKPNSDGYYVGTIAGNLHWVTDTLYQAMFLTTPNGVVLVDAPPTIGHNLQRAIDAVADELGLPSQVTHLVYSHFHADHIGAASLFGQDIERIAHSETLRLLQRAGDPNRPLPTTTFDDVHTVDVGGEKLQLAHQGPNHSPDNIFIFAPAQSTLMLVDVLFPGWVPFKSFAVSQDIPGWFRAHDQALEYPFETLVAGHVGRLGTREDVLVQRSYLGDLNEATRDAIASVDPSSIYQELAPNAWAIFKKYMDTVSERAAEPVVEKYENVLAGTDVYTFLHAAAMLDTLRLDAGDLGPFGVHP